ncbi:hypothetical protein D3C81_1286420 [compost metagenome]
MDRGSRPRRPGSGVAVLSSNACRPAAAQLPCAGVGDGDGADRWHRPATAAFCRDPATALPPPAGRPGAISGKAGLYLRTDHRIEPRTVVHQTSFLAPARYCRSGGAGDGALSEVAGQPAAGAGNPGADEQCHRHERRSGVVRSGHRGIGRGTGDRCAAVARQQDAQRPDRCRRSPRRRHHLRRPDLHVHGRCRGGVPVRPVDRLRDDGPVHHL